MPSPSSNQPRAILVQQWRQHGAAWVASSALIAVATLVAVHLLWTLTGAPASADDPGVSMTLLGWIGGLLLVQHGLRQWRAERFRQAGSSVARCLADAIQSRPSGWPTDLGAATPDAIQEAGRTLRVWARSSVWSSVFDLPLALLCVAGLWWLHPWLGVAALAPMMLLGLCTGWLLRRPSKPLPGSTDAVEGTGLHTCDILEQAPSWRALNIQPLLTQRWVSQRLQSIEARKQLMGFANGIRAASRMVLLSVVVTVALLAGTLLGPQGESMAMVSAAVAGLLAAGAVTPLLRLMPHVPHLRHAQQAWRLLESVLYPMSQPVASLSELTPGAVLTVERLRMGSGGSDVEAMLEWGPGVDLAVAPGEVVAVLGRSGAGKSRLLRIMSGQQHLSHGVVRWGGVALSSWPAHELARHVGYLPQDVELLDGTLAENLVRFGPPDRAMVNRALNDAGLLTSVSRWPLGVDTRLGAQGLRLSGSWRQRIALARALYGRPSLLLLDEPACGLDRSGEAALERAIQEFKSRGGAAVVVSRRPGLLRLADRLCLLRDGQVLAHGPRDHVIPTLRPADPPTGREPVRPPQPVLAVPAELHPA